MMTKRMMIIMIMKYADDDNEKANDDNDYKNNEDDSNNNKKTNMINTLELFPEVLLVPLHYISSPFCAYACTGTRVRPCTNYRDRRIFILIQKSTYYRQPSPN